MLGGMSGRPVAIVLGWLAAAAGAVTVGVIAVSALGDSITAASPSAMSEGEVRAALSRSSATPPDAGTDTQTPDPTPKQTPTKTGQPTPTKTPTRTPAATATSTPHGFGSPGGQATAACDGDLAVLRSWSPAQGFEVDDVDRGPDREASVTFENDAGEHEIVIGCRDGEPLRVANSDDSSRSDDDSDD